MTSILRPSTRGWLLVLLLASVFLIWGDVVRIRRVNSATGLAQEGLSLDAKSPTGFGGGLRELIVPEHNEGSYRWIAQTQQMFAHDQWRVRQVVYENAPFGHAVYTASPYRWWLGLVAWLDHTISGRPLGACVERAALLADPILHFVLLVSATVFVARIFGSTQAALLSLGLVAVFPFGGGFIPGAPDDRTFGLCVVLWSTLFLLAGIRPRSRPVASPVGKEPLVESGGIDRDRSRRWFFLSGVMGGLGLWINLPGQFPFVFGTVVGGLIAAWIIRDKAKAATPHDSAAANWRAWALGGGAASLAAYLVEFFPDHLGDWQLRVNHPAYALAWLGGGELVALAFLLVSMKAPGRRTALIVRATLAIAAMAVLPVAMKFTASQGFLAADLASFRLTALPDGVVAAHFWAWLVRDGLSAAIWVCVLPLLVVGPAVWLLVRGNTPKSDRIMLLVTLVPVLVALGYACRQLYWWNGLDVASLLLLLAAITAMEGVAGSRLARRTWVGVAMLVVLGGITQLMPRLTSETTRGLTQLEVEGLIERDMAQWLAKRVAGKRAVVLATPKQTASLHFYGGISGLGTLGWENQDGLGAAIRIASATTAEEALELVRRREVTHIVVPSWDPYLDEYARMGLGHLEGSFMGLLRRWQLPPWLQPVTYQLPRIAGLENQTVAILEVVEDQDEAAAASRLAEYFVEMGQGELANSSAQALQRYPADLGAIVARAQVELAREDGPAFSRTLELARARLAAGADRRLPWDRRASLAVVLARGKHADLSRVQVQRCLDDVDEAQLRSLSTGQLYRLMVLSKAFNLSIADPRLRTIALDLLPTDLRNRL